MSLQIPKVVADLEALRPDGRRLLVEWHAGEAGPRAVAGAFPFTGFDRVVVREKAAGGAYLGLDLIPGPERTGDPGRDQMTPTIKRAADGLIALENLHLRYFLGEPTQVLTMAAAVGWIDPAVKQVVGLRDLKFSLEDKALFVGTPPPLYLRLAGLLNLRDPNAGGGVPVSSPVPIRETPLILGSCSFFGWRPVGPVSGVQVARVQFEGTTLPSKHLGIGLRVQRAIEPSEEIGAEIRLFHLALRPPRPSPGAVLAQRAVPFGSRRQKGIVPWKVSLEGVPWLHREFLERWNERVAYPYLDALTAVQDGRPISMVPAFDVPGGRDPSDAVLEYDLEDHDPAGKGSRRFSIFALVPGPTGGQVVIKSAVVRASGPTASGQFEWPQRIAFPGFRGHSGQALDLEMLVEPVHHFNEVPEPSWDRGRVVLAAWMQKRSAANGNGPRADEPSTPVRFDALDLRLLEFLRGGDDDEPRGGGLAAIERRARGKLVVSIRAEPAKARPMTTDIRPRTIRRFSLSARLPMLEILPGSQDPLAGSEFVPFRTGEGNLTDDKRFARQPPVTVPILGPPASPSRIATGRSPLWLDVTEETQDERSQTLRLSIQRVDETVGQAAVRVAVLDREPFLVAAADVGLVGRKTQEGILEVGQWSADTADGARWTLSGGDEGLALDLPPQAVGEGTEKRRGQAPAWIGIDETHPADFRLSPVTRLLLRASEAPRRYVEPPWNLRRLLGSPGQNAPLARVQDIRFELLYGLEARVHDGDALLRLAELSVQLGDVPGPMAGLSWIGTGAQHKAFDDYLTRWADRHRLYRTRLAALALSDPGVAGMLRLTGRISFAIRPSAWLYYPFEPGPLPGLPDVSAQRPHSNVGLAGGVGWGFEAKSIYDKVFSKPDSTSAELVAPHFSALGGWGRQKAGFDNDKTTITSDTAMGRVHRYTVERIGRIGVLWTRARHVIVYERAMAPSRQFAASQDPLLDRPVLRKVAEYIEFPHKDRAYPDGDVSPVSRGFLTGSSFPPRIAVDSSWGSDVLGPNPNDAKQEATVGWQVPLWSRDPTIDPEVYPKPTIHLDLACDPKRGQTSNPSQCDNPEVLYFYTSLLDSDGRDTDRWPAVGGVDYPDLPTPQPPSVPSIDEANPDGRLPDATAVEPGYERFTIALSAAPLAANLVAERSSQAMTARLHTVTLTRSLPAASPAAITPALKAAMDATGAVAPIGSGVQSLLTKLRAAMTASGEIGPDARPAIKQAVAGAVDDFNRAAADASGVYASAIRNLEALKPGDFDANALADGMAKQASLAVGGWLDRTSKNLQNARDDLSALLGMEGLTADKVLAKVDELRDRVLVGVPDASATANDADGKYRDLVGTLRTGLEEPGRALGQAQSLIDQGLGQIGLDARAAVEDMRGRIAAAKGQGAVGNAARDELARTARARAALIASRLEEMESRVDSALRSQAPALAWQVREPFGRVRRAVASLASEIGRIADGPPDGFDGLLRLFGRMPGATDGLKGALGTIAGAYKDSLDRVADRVQKLKDTPVQFFIDLEKRLRDQINQTGLDPTRLRSIAEDLVTDFTTRFARGATELNGLVADAKAPFAAALKAAENPWNAAKGGLEEILKADGLKKRLADALDPSVPAAEVGLLLERLRSDLDGLKGDFDRALGGAADAVQGQLRDLIRQAKTENPAAIAAGLFQGRDTALRLVRAFGEAPVVDGMAFNREKVAYYLDALSGGKVRTTPITALVNRAGDDLKAMGLRVPTGEILDRLIPDDLKNFDLSKILPDFAGLKLDRLFQGLKMPEGVQDKVKVRHGFDKQARRAWLETEVDVPFSEPATLFEFGPVLVRLDRALFHALTRLEAEATGSSTQKAEGRLEGDWGVVVAGLPVVTFRQTALRFDESKRVKFDLKPDKVELQGILRPIAEAIAKLGMSEGGLSIRPAMNGGMPVGVQSILDLPLPAVQLGTFGISGLRLVSTFELTVLLGGTPPVDFSLGVGLGLGRKTAPFTLTIFILGGAGWFEVEARYRPMSGQITTRVSIGLAAAAALAISLGPIRGSVAVYFGATAEFQSGGGTATNLQIGIILLVRGEVEVFGFISVTIVLMLEAQYVQGGTLIGRGSVSIRVKICWFLTLKFSASVTLTFGGGGDGIADARPGPFDVEEGPLLALAGPGGFRSMPVAQVDPFRSQAERHLRMFR